MRPFRWTPIVRWVNKKNKRQEEIAKAFAPVTSTYAWFTLVGFLQRLTFAGTMGVVAVAMSGVLWIISLPWVAWSLVRWVVPSLVSVAG